jgi:hypothetical protein
LRLVGRRKISPLNRKAIPPTIIATPIVSISKAQKNIVAAVSKIAKVEFEIAARSVLAGYFVLDGAEVSFDPNSDIVEMTGLQCKVAWE